MHDGIKRARPEQLVKACPVPQVADYQLGGFRHSLAMAAAQVIEDDHCVSSLQ
jgi:hypothetical protein